MDVFASLDSRISQFLKQHGITLPTEIQEKAIPSILSTDDNLLILAPTGTGKTEAALLPLLHQILAKKEEQGGLYGFYILYVTPLRALNRDVFKRIEGLCDHIGLTVSVRHGDTSQYFRRKQSLNPPSLLITTPESLQAILPGKRLRYNLKTVFTVVVDEVHELADSKRGAQLSLALERLERLVGRPIRRIGLSATVGNPREIARLLGGMRYHTKTIWAGYKNRDLRLQVEMPTPTKIDYELSKRIAYPAHSTARLRRIVELINAHRSTIIFTNTRSFAEILGAKMHLLHPDFEFDVHHGSLSKSIRHAAEDRLKSGQSRAIIATSSLELGIDIGYADLVIQYSSPREVSRALQRTGRAGHAVGKISEGVFISTVNIDDIAESGVILKRARSNKVEPAEIPTNAWDVLCHQIAGILLDMGEIDVIGLLEIVRSAYPFHSVDEKQLETILSFMIQQKLARREDDSVKMGYGTRQYYYENLSMIPDIRQITAVDSVTRKSIGVLDEDYVADNVETGSVFIIRGRPYQVVTIEENEVLCAPISEKGSEAPRWVGEMIPVPYEVASEVADVWNRITTESEERSLVELATRYGLSENASRHLYDTISKTKSVLGILPDKNRLVIESFGETIVIHAPFGTRTNEALGIVIASLLTTQTGSDVAVEQDPYRILLTASDLLHAEDVKKILSGYNREQVSFILRLALRNTQTFASRFIHVARRMRIIKKDARIKEIPVKYLINAYSETPVFYEAMQEVLREKMDENRVGDIFEDVAAGKRKLVIVRTEKPSPLARLILEGRSRFEVMGELTDEDEILRLLETRLRSSRLRLVCLTGDWDSVRTISTLDDPIACPLCGSKLIAVTSTSDTSLRAIIRKRKRGKTLSKEEEKKFRSAMLSATMVSTYGKLALLTMAGRGIGPTTASRILTPSSAKDRLQLLRAIAKAEKTYAQTRQFWD
ncbi:MAG: DEAD/DEAH box helicase [Candidatus Thorarchaeota archaeon]